jgi:hypothetical protein
MIQVHEWVSCVGAQVQQALEAWHYSRICLVWALSSAIKFDPFNRDAKTTKSHHFLLVVPKHLEFVIVIVIKN